MLPNMTLSMLRSGRPPVAPVARPARSGVALLAPAAVVFVGTWPGCAIDVAMIIGLLRPKETDC